MSVLLRVMFCCFVVMMLCVEVVAVSHMSVMSGLLVVARPMVLSGLLVMVRSVFAVLCSAVVMFCCRLVFGHRLSP